MDRFHIGKRVKYYRRRRRMSVEALSGLLGLSPSWVRMVERGKLNADRLGTLLDLARALRVDLDTFLCAPIPGVPEGDHAQVLALLRSAFTSKDPRRALADVARTLEIRDAGEDLMLLVDPGGRLRIVQRRDALTDVPIAGISLAAPLGQGLDPDRTSELAGAVDAGAVGPSVASSFQVIDREYLRLSDQVDPVALLPGMALHLRLLQSLRGAGTSEEAEARLRSAASSMAQYSGWVNLWALGDGAAADRHYRMALRAAHDAGDRFMAGLVLSSMSDLASNLGDRQEGVRLAEAAVAHAAETPWPLLWVDAASTKALAHAHAGEPDAFRAESDRVEAGLAEIVEADEPGFIGGFDEPWLIGHQGVGLALLGEAESARAVLGEAMALLPPALARTRAYFLAALAGGLFQAGEITEACRVGIEAADLLGQRGSALVMRMLVELDRKLDPHRSSVPAVRELHERLLAL